MLNYFGNRSTNASEESLIKTKAFRTQYRELRKIDFSLLRII